MPVADNGIVLTATLGPVEFWEDKHGDIVHREWYVTYAGAATPISWIEIIG